MLSRLVPSALGLSFNCLQKWEFFLWSKKMMPLFIPSDFSHAKCSRRLWGTSRLSFNCLQNGKFVVQKNDAIFILSGLSYENLPEGSRVWKDWCDLVETRSRHFKMDLNCW